MMRPIHMPLPAPITPPVPHGLQRGGVMDADWVPPTYVDAARPTIPTNSPAGSNVAQDIFRQRIAFQQPDQPRPITSMNGLGAAQYLKPAGMPPLPISPYHTPMTPHGAEAGGIFGTDPAPMIQRPQIPQRRPSPPVLAGFGMSPDGLGGCGCGCVGSNC